MGAVHQGLERSSRCGLTGSGAGFLVGLTVLLRLRRLMLLSRELGWTTGSGAGGTGTSPVTPEAPSSSFLPSRYACNFVFLDRRLIIRWLSEWYSVPLSFTTIECCDGGPSTQRSLTERWISQADPGGGGGSGEPAAEPGDSVIPCSAHSHGANVCVKCRTSTVMPALEHNTGTLSLESNRAVPITSPMPPCGNCHTESCS